MSIDTVQVYPLLIFFQDNRPNGGERVNKDTDAFIIYNPIFVDVVVLKVEYAKIFCLE